MTSDCKWKEQIEVILKKKKLIQKAISQGVEDYSAIKRGHEKCQEDDPEFRRLFECFYRLRFRKKIEVEKMYALIKKRETFPIDTVIQELVVDRRKPCCNFVFATKVLHTIDNDLPIYDSIVGKFFDLKTTGQDYKSKVASAAKIYNTLKELYKDRNNNGLSELAAMFDKMYSSTGFSEIKKIDFVIWGNGKI